jgi:restriction system protein
MSKHARLLAVARKRRSVRWDGYGQIGDYHNGAYECDFVSPYTKTAGNVDAGVMILLQDWSSHERLSGPLDREAVRSGHTPCLATNKNLVRLLRDSFGLELRDVYGTNLFPFIKKGGLSSRIPLGDMTRAALEFGLPQIRIIRPRLVVCIGLQTFNGIRRACGMESLDLPTAIASPFSLDSSRVWCQAHTGALGQMNRNRGRPDQVSRDWERMRADVEISKEGR